MAIGDYDVTIVFDQMDPVKNVANMDACDCQLHRPHGFDANAIGMTPFDGNSIDQWHALSPPNFAFEAGWIGGLEMGADELESGSWPFHDNSRDPIATNGGHTDFIQIDDDGFCDAVNPIWETDETNLGIDRFLNRLRVVSLTITDGTEVDHS